MYRWVVVVLVSTLLALVAATVWVPAHDWVTWDVGPQDPVPWIPDDTAYMFVGALWAPPVRCELKGVTVGPALPEVGWTTVRPVWPLLLGTHALILLLGSALLTAVVHRERRRAGQETA